MVRLVVEEMQLGVQQARRVPITLELAQAHLIRGRGRGRVRGRVKGLGVGIRGRGRRTSRSFSLPITMPTMPTTAMHQARKQRPALSANGCICMRMPG